ncbi:MAG: Ni/Fe-hydrogenase cytochrome b subunit [Ignavibacteriae bacterium]|nr:MAG: Ni/Fe-hydrogenase cytochrome b subunit [Ignavibacteriota bacterium]
MDFLLRPTPINKKFITPVVFILILLAINGLVFLATRFIFGLGATTNLCNQHPWGIWIAIDVATGVALAAGGFTSAALGHIIHKERYHAILRPALLTAMLGYTFVAIGVFVDLGRYYSIWHPLIMWNGTSPLFEVGICVMIYATVLYIEFLPIVTEKFLGIMRFKRSFLGLNKPIYAILRFLDRGLEKTMFIFIIAGVVLSTLHQSSLGTLMVIAGPKMHPLWQTPILPLLFLISAIAVGFPMIIFESLLASRSLGLKMEMDILTRLAKRVAPLLGIYLAVKLIDMVIRGTYVYLTEINVQSVMFVLEIVIGIIIPLRMLFSEKVLKSPLWLFVSASFVVAGVVINRINCFLVAYSAPYALDSYFPSIGEISVTVGFIAILVLLYRAFVMFFPIISVPDRKLMPKTKYSIMGGEK